MTDVTALPTELPGAPIWIDLSTPDPARSRAFYGALFGWGVVDPGPDYGGYVNFLAGDVPVAGCMEASGSLEAGGWMIYLNVADAEATVAAAAAAGAQVLVPAMAVLELGSMAIVADPSGAGIGMWQPGLHTGFVRDGAFGTPSWFELHTPSYDATLDFYRSVFGWDVEVMGDTPEFRYSTLRSGGERPLAGVMDNRAWVDAATPGRWSVYFRAEDCDATIARALELGATVLMPAEDTPYGRLAELADPCGAAFKLQQV